MTAVENAIEDEIHRNRFFLETVNLQGVAFGSTVVADTTPGGMGQIHIAATLPVADDGTDGCDDEAPLVGVMAGQAGVGFTKVLTGTHNTGIEGRADLDDDADFDNSGTTTNEPDVDMCVFHRTITTADISNDGNLLTDVVVIGTNGTLPADAFITVSGNLLAP